MVVSLEQDCERVFLTEEERIENFDCGNEDLNDFFNREAILYQRQMLAETVFFRHKSSGAVVGAFSYSASSIKMADLPSARGAKVKKLVPREKMLKAYPGHLIGRLGVAKQFSGQGVGAQLMEFIIDFTIIHYPHHVRYLLVDAYNEPAVISFYQKNDFTTVFSTEEQEKETYELQPSDVLRTRYMFFDMMKWRD